MPFSISKINLSKLKLSAAVKYSLEDASNRLSASTVALTAPSSASSTPMPSPSFIHASSKEKRSSSSTPKTATNREDAFESNDDNGAVLGVSISAKSAESQFSYIPSMQTAKSLAVDIIQLTRFRNRRPTLLEDKQQRKPSTRNMFLGVPEIRRRFSHDIRSDQLAKLAYLAAPPISISGDTASTSSSQYDNDGNRKHDRGGGLDSAIAASNVRAFVGPNSETKRVLLLQVFIPFLLSGFGNVGAGLFLNFAQSWTVFRETKIFYMLLATVMAFKTNLEATLAARLSTSSNMGSMRGARKKLDSFIGNLSLVMTQSIIFGFMAGLLTVLVRTLQSGNLNLALGAQVIATSMAAIVANELLSSLIILGVVVASERAGVNPDNVSTLIAAMLGDLTSVFFVSVTAAMFHKLGVGAASNSSSTAAAAAASINKLFVAIIVGLMACVPLTYYVSARNAFTSNMFLSTNLPLTLAVFVATMSGCVFDHAIRKFSRIAIYQAVVNGVSVNLMAVQASRISTYLQQVNNINPHYAQSIAKVYSPIKALTAKDMNASVARWLIAMCVPAISVYLCLIFLVCPKDSDITFAFIACCLLSITIQVTAVQCLTYMVTPFSWRMEWDPDNVVIPVLMSISDCFGNAILLASFMLLKYINDPNSVGQKPVD